MTRRQMDAVAKNYTASLTKTAVMESSLTGMSTYAVIQNYTTGPLKISASDGVFDKKQFNPCSTDVDTSSISVTLSAPM